MNVLFVCISFVLTVSGIFEVERFFLSSSKNECYICLY